MDQREFECAIEGVGSTFLGVLALEQLKEFYRWANRMDAQQVLDGLQEIDEGAQRMYLAGEVTVERVGRVRVLLHWLGGLAQAQNFPLVGDVMADASSRLVALLEGKVQR